MDLGSQDVVGEIHVFGEEEGAFTDALGVVPAQVIRAMLGWHILEGGVPALGVLKHFTEYPEGCAEESWGPLPLTVTVGASASRL